MGDAAEQKAQPGEALASGASAQHWRDLPEGQGVTCQEPADLLGEDGGGLHGAGGGGLVRGGRAGRRRAEAPAPRGPRRGRGRSRRAGPRSGSGARSGGGAAPGAAGKHLCAVHRPPTCALREARGGALPGRAQAVSFRSPPPPPPPKQKANRDSKEPRLLETWHPKPWTVDFKGEDVKTTVLPGMGRGEKWGAGPSRRAASEEETGPRQA